MGQAMTDVAQGGNTQAVEQSVSEIYQFAAGRMRAGTSPAAIEQELAAKGLDAESAAIVVRNLKQALKSQKRSRGLRNMGIGALVCVVGVAITAATYSMASGGGHYVVAWGAVVFGGIQFLRGLFELATA